MKNTKNRENDAKRHQKDVENTAKSSQNNIRVSIQFNKQFLDDFDDAITYFGYSRSSAILEACIKFMSELSKKRIIIEKSKKLRYDQK